VQFSASSSFGNVSGSGAGINVATGAMVPVTNTILSGGYDNAMDLGSTSARFKDLYLSGGLRGDTLKFSNLAGSERMRIDSSGNVLVGESANFIATSTTATGLALTQDGRFTLSRSGTPMNVGRLGSDGSLIDFWRQGSNVGSISVTGSSTAYNTSSDYRLKELDVPMTGATERVKALRPINFAWKVDGSRVDGFFAHELAEVVPEAATGTKDAMMDEEYEVTPAVVDAEGVETTAAVMGTRSVPDYQGIDQSKLVPLLTATIQELIARIEILESGV
jgi:hypothetical protein